MKRNRTPLFMLALLTAGYVALVALSSLLPQRVPIHFDVYGRPNGWTARFHAPFSLKSSPLCRRCLPLFPF